MSDTKFELSDEQLSRIAEMAAKKIGEVAATAAINQLRNEAYTTVGRSALKALVWMGTLLVVGLFLWAVGKGYISPTP